MDICSPVITFDALGNQRLPPSEYSAPTEPEVLCSQGSHPTDENESVAKELTVEKVPDDYFDDFEEDLSDPQCVQRIYDFSLSQVRGMVDYNDEDDIIQEVFYRLHKWPIGNKYNSAKHYFSLLKITIRQAIAAYWKRRHSQRNDARKRVFISQLQLDGQRGPQFAAESTEVWHRLHIQDLVRRVMAKASTLSDEQRVMFQLRFLEQKSHEEVAQVLGISIRTSYRIEAKIRDTLQRFFPDVDLEGLRR